MMSNRSSSCSSENAIDFEELSEFRRELRKEKDMLKDSQSQGFELIRGLEMHVKSLSDSRIEDRRRIKELERELKNCLQEIDYLQDQVNSRNTEVCNLQLRLADTEDLGEEIVGLREQLKRSDFEKLLLIHELEKKDRELNGSLLCIDKLEETMSSIGLEYQCEIESLKLDIEQISFEANKSHEETQENARMSDLIKDLELQILEAEQVIECLDKENRYFMEKIESCGSKEIQFFRKVEDLVTEFETSKMNEKVFYRKVKECLHDWHNGAGQSSNELPEDTRNCSDLVPALPKLAGLGESDAHLKDQLDKMSSQIHDYELLVSQLKEELKREKVKAKDNTDDLAQEMAELRYHMTELLEEERKRRSCVEQVALHRIAELEAQLGKEEAPRQERKLIKHIEVTQKS